MLDKFKSFFKKKNTIPLSKLSRAFELKLISELEYFKLKKERADKEYNDLLEKEKLIKKKKK